MGTRGASTAYSFKHDLAGRLANRIQLTTDGHCKCDDAELSAFGSDIDYAMPVKLHGNDRESETRYRSAECIGCRAIPIAGEPQSSAYLYRLSAHCPFCPLDNYEIIGYMKARTFRAGHILSKLPKTGLQDSPPPFETLP
jgi:hypothetical protein